MSNSKVDVISLSLGIGIGFFLGSVLKPAGVLLMLYSIIVFVARCIVAFCVNTTTPTDFANVYNGPDVSRVSGKDLDIHFDYNIFTNTVTVTRSMGTVIKTDKDRIQFLIKKTTSIVFFWDIFNHVSPLKVVFV
ncbi:hypothetical protein YASMINEVIRUS_377 [Yasminevirus sp. GU-2018]|uniref:Uncharacterized protein n=1 Tax=Yasminevirus sp. GU-2018 TaxID=2420051 RepID=A0A5K0U8W1_9VIRU|nr:hypothetical protein YASMINEVIRUS_377 [Yasminevirus sp. GU-2018]